LIPPIFLLREFFKMNTPTLKEEILSANISAHIISLHMLS
jgi:hypothetical protein